MGELSIIFFLKSVKLHNWCLSTYPLVKNSDITLKPSLTTTLSPSPSPLREGSLVHILLIFHPVHSCMCIYVCIFRRCSVGGACVCLLNTNIILQLSFLNQQGWGSPSYQWSSCFIPGWKIWLFINRHLGFFSNFWYCKQSCRECTFSFILSLCFTLFIAFHGTDRLITFSRKIFSPVHPVIQAIYWVIYILASRWASKHRR